MAEQTASLKVFVSYSRADVAFADQLVLVLEDKGFVAILDRHDISGAENWRERLGKLILSADAVAFVLTPQSATSEICAWEVAEAARLGKRIIPLTPEPLEGAQPPQALGELNWIPFYAEPTIPGSGFYYGVKRLVEALSIDLDWLRAQTRYSERAMEWAGDRREDLLLRGEALKEAEAWQARTPPNTHPPDVVREYLAASGDAEQHRQAAAKAQLEEREQALKLAEVAVADSKRAQERLRRFSVWALVAGVLLLAVAIPGNYFAAVRTLDANDRRAALFADAANDLARQGDYNRALLIALAGDPPARTGLLEDLMRPEGNIAVRNALERAYAGDRSVATVATGSEASALVALPDGRRFLTVHADGVRLWTMGETLQATKLLAPDTVKRVFPLPESDDVLMQMTSADREWFGIWSLTDGKITRTIGPTFNPAAMEAVTATVDVMGEWLVVAAGKTLTVWDIEEGIEGPSVTVDTFGFLGLAANSDDDLVVATTTDDMVQVWNPDEGVLKPPVESAFGDIRTVVIVDGSDAIFGAEGGQVGSIDEDGKLTAAFATFGDNLNNVETVVSMVVAADERGVLLVSEGGQVRLLDMPSTGLSEPFGRRTDIRAAGFVSGLGLIAAVTKDGVVMASGFGASKLAVSLDELFQGEHLTGPLAASVVNYSAEGPLVMALEEGGTLVWRPETRSVTKTPTHGPDARTSLRGIAVSPDGQTLFVAYDTRVEVWKAGAAQRTASWPVGTSEAPLAEVHSLGDGAAFLVRASDGMGAVVKTDTGEFVFAPKNFGTTGVAASPDGRLLVHAGENETLVLHRAGVADPETIKLRGEAFHIAFSPDGAFMAIGMSNGFVDLWRPGETRPFQSIKAHVSTVTNVAVHADGKLFATTGEDGRAHLWKVGVPDPVQTFELPDPNAASLVIDDPAERLMVLLDDGLIEYDINPILRAGVDEQVKLACARLDARGVAGFTDQDYVEFTFLEKVARDPCQTLGVRTKAAATP